jgi:hypothetical protein
MTLELPKATNARKATCDNPMLAFGIEKSEGSMENFWGKVKVKE